MDKEVVSVVVAVLEVGGNQQRGWNRDEIPKLQVDDAENASF